MDSAHPVKVVMAVVGLDQHEVGSLVVSRILSQAGMEVVYLGRFNTPESVVAAAVAEDADVVGVSCHSWEYLEFADELVERLAGAGVPLVLGGSVITSADAADLKRRGVAEVFGPSADSDAIVAGIRSIAGRS